MPEKILIWGASGHALIVADIIRLTGIYELIGFLDNVNPRRKGSEFFGSRILGGEEQLDLLREQGVESVIFGFGNCLARLRLGELVLKKGFSLVTAVHPSAVIAVNVSIGQGTVIAAGSVVNPGAKIGKNVIINTSASVDHECIIENGAHICPGVHLAGRVMIGRASWVGIGSTIIDYVHVGAGSLIGAGSVVVENIPDDVVAYGNPAKIIRNVTVNDWKNTSGRSDKAGWEARL